MITILITSDPYLVIKNNEIINQQNVAILKQGYSNIEHAIILHKDLEIGTIIRVLDPRNVSGIVTRN